MRYIINALLLLVSVHSVAQVPRVFVLDAKILKENRSRVLNKDVTLMPSFRQLIKEAEKALKEGPFSVMEKTNVPPSGDKHDYMSLAPYHWPDSSKHNGLPYLRRDGQTNPEVREYKDKEYMPRLCALVETLGLAYYFTGNETYAEHAARLVRVWFLDAETRMNPNLKYAQAIKGVNEGRGAGLIDSRHFIRLIDGIGLLHSSKHWKNADQKGMQEWFSEFLSWMQTHPNGRHEMEAENNHGTWYDAQRLSMAFFIDSTGLAKKIVASALDRLDKQMDAEGKFPKEMERTISLHYNVFNLEAFYLIASMSEKTGMDIWHQVTPSGKSLKKGFDFLYPYLTQQKVWTGQQIKPFPFDEGYPLLMKAERKYNCRDCEAAVKKIAGPKGDRLREWLVY